MIPRQDTREHLEAALPAERMRLVRFCAHLTGSFDDAEDLAQETLIEAWRHAAKLYDPSGHAPWLLAIARNVCLRWARRRGRDLARLATSAVGAVDEVLEHRADDSYDLEIALERSELAELLDRVLALLPPGTRAALVAHYVEETPHAEIAARLGLSEGAVKLRVHRGKLQLRRLLATHLPADAVAYGLSPAHAEQETRIWCPICGKARLWGSLLAPSELRMRCPQCNRNANLAPTTMLISHEGVEPLFSGIKGYKAALGRAARSAQTQFGRAVADRTMPCLTCGRFGDVRVISYHHARLPVPRYALHRVCETCDRSSSSALYGAALCQPAIFRFWHAHRRVRLLPERAMDYAGRPAILTTFESIASAATVDVIFDRETFALRTIQEH